jgi:hypothetical protein
MEIALSGHRIVRIELPLATIYKPLFGASGLSADLLQMEKAELSNYGTLRRAGHIGRITHVLLFCWSLAKFFRRLVIVAMRNWQR